MKRVPFTKLIIIVVFAGVAGGVLYVTQSAKSEKRVIATESTIPVALTQPSNAKSAPVTLPKGQYLAYSPDVIKNTPGTKLLFFHAPWCSQCQAIDASIKEQGIPDGVSIIKADYDSNTQLRAQYGVTLQTTFVRVDDAGNLIEKFVAYREPTFESVRRELL